MRKIRQRAWRTVVWWICTSLVAAFLAACGEDDPVARPDPSGACCAVDLACAVRTESECAAASGFYQGEDSVCEPDPCAELAGACCLPGGDCELRTRAACDSGAGFFVGIDAPCASASCAAEPPGFRRPEPPVLEGLGDGEAQAFVSKHVHSTRVLLDYVDVLPSDPRWRGIGRMAPCWEHSDTSGACVTTYDVCREGSEYQWNGSLRGECEGQPVADVPYLRATTSFDLRSAVLEFLDPMAGDVTVTVEWEPTSLSGGIGYTLYNGLLVDRVVLAALELSPNREEHQIAWEVPHSVRWTAAVGTFRFFIWNKSAETFRIQTEIEWDGSGHGRIRTYDDEGGVGSEREWGG